jgi:hypothetical protein
MGFEDFKDGGKDGDSMRGGPHGGGEIECYFNDYGEEVCDEPMKGGKQECYFDEYGEEICE